MAIDPTTTTTVKVSELASAGYNTTDLIPHEVAGILKKGNLQDLATFIGSIIDVEGSVGFRAVNVTDGQTLPATTEEEFILVGPGTFPNVGGGSAITTTEPLNALVSNGTYWFIGVEIPIAASGAWGSIEGNIETQTDLQDALDLKADLVDGKVPASQLPSYVDDVVEVANYAALPSTGETGKIYITIDTNKVYRWSGSAYIEIAENNAVWGLIEGTLSSQTDLNTALGLKVPYTGATGNVDLGSHKLTASDLVINHASGSGAAATISKGGNGEALTVTKSSGSGNAASILGGVTLLDELHLNTDLADAYIASAATWNAKQSALTFSSPLVNTSGTISIPAASGSVNGYLSSTDWTTFNTKQTALNGTGFVKISGTTISYDNTTYLSGTVAIANGGTGATTASAARTNLGATTVGANIFTIPNPNPVTKAYIRANADNTVEWLDGNAFRESIGAGTGNGTVTSVNGTGSYGGLTLTGTVTGSGDLTLGGTPTGSWPISITGNAASVNTVQVSTNADFYLTFADANNGSPTSEFLYTIGSVKVNPSTGALTASSFVKSGGTSSQFLMADGSVSTGSGGTVTGTGTSGQIAYWNGTSSITGESNLFWDDTNNRLGIGTTSPASLLNIASTFPQFTLTRTDNGTNAAAAINFAAQSTVRWQIATNAAVGTGFEINQADSSTNRFYINPSGNVGIGTTSPAAKFHIKNNVQSNSITRANSAAVFEAGDGVLTIGQVVAFGDANNYGMWLQSQKNDDSTGIYFPLNIQPAGGNTILNSASGKVLIGTTTDAGQNLQVAGNAIIGTSSSTSQFRFYRTTNVAGFEIQGGSGSASAGGSAYLRLGDVTNSRYWMQQINNSYNLAYWFFDGGSWSQPITFTNNGSASFAGSVTATSGFFNSDNRLKDLTDYDYNVSDIKPITYLWKDGRDNKKHVGYLAQEVQKVMPDAVNEDDKGFLSVNYVEVLVAQVELLNNRMAEMQKEIELLKSK